MASGKPEKAQKKVHEEAKPIKKPSRREFLRIAGMGAVAAALGFSPLARAQERGERAASAEAQARPPAQSAAPRLEPITQQEVMEELVPAIERSRQYLREVTISRFSVSVNGLQNWEVELHPGCFPSVQDLIVLDVYAKTPNGRVKAGEALVSTGKFIVLEIPTQETEYAGAGVLAIVDNGTISFSYYDKQTKQYNTIGRGALGVRMDSKPAAAVFQLSDQSGINIVFLPESALQRDSSGHIVSVSIGTHIVGSSLILNDRSLGCVDAFANGLIVTG